MNTGYPLNTEPNWLTKYPNTVHYALAIIELFSMARKDCSGSRACAQVLLSAYNGLEINL